MVGQVDAGGDLATEAGFVAEMLAGDAHRSVNAEFVPDAELGRGMGTGPAVRFACWRGHHFGEDAKARAVAPVELHG
jgi:hypothetical protein